MVVCVLILWFPCFSSSRTFLGTVCTLLVCLFICTCWFGVHVWVCFCMLNHINKTQKLPDGRSQTGCNKAIWSAVQPAGIIPHIPDCLNPPPNKKIRRHEKTNPAWAQIGEGKRLPTLSPAHLLPPCACKRGCNGLGLSSDYASQNQQKLVCVCVCVKWQISALSLCTNHAIMRRKVLDAPCFGASRHAGKQPRTHARAWHNPVTSPSTCCSTRLDPCPPELQAFPLLPWDAAWGNKDVRESRQGNLPEHLAFELQ